MTIVFARRLDSPITLCIDSCSRFVSLFQAPFWDLLVKVSSACTTTLMLRCLEQKEHGFGSSSVNPCSVRTVAYASLLVAAAQHAVR